ncbi:MAG: WD40 repeat domain-containing protein [Pirellulales bacterium]
MATPEGPLGAVDSIAFSPDGRIVCTGGFDGRIKLWNSRTWRELETRIEGRHVARVRSVAFSPDGKTLASGSQDGTIRLWHVATGGHLLTLRGHTTSVDSVAFSPDAKMLASGSRDGTISHNWTCPRFRFAVDESLTKRRSSSGEKGRARAPCRRGDRD